VAEDTDDAADAWDDWQFESFEDAQTEEGGRDTVQSTSQTSRLAQSTEEPADQLARLESKLDHRETQLQHVIERYEAILDETQPTHRTDSSGELQQSETSPGRDQGLIQRLIEWVGAN